MAAQSTTNAPKVFPGHAGKISVQSVADTVGLDRIILIPLKEGVTPEAATETLQGFSEVEYVEPNYIYHIDALPARDSVIAPNDSLYNGQWYLRDIGVPDAWKVTEGDSTIHIGFVDTGVDWGHPDLVNQFAINPKEDINHNGLFDPWPSTVKDRDAHGDSVFGDLDGIDEDGNGFVDDVIGYNFVDQSTLNYGKSQGRDAIPVDQNGHGTAIAGLMCAEQNNHIGISGVAPKCKLVALRAFDLTGNAEDDDIAAAIVYAADNNVRILNLSFGDVVPSLLQRDAIRYATSKNVLVFASSGNYGGDSRHYPSDFDECVSAGATQRPPYQDQITTFSEFSEQLDLVAPGDSIEALTAGDSGYSNAFGGTSASSPIAAATAALLLSARPDLTPIELRSILESTTRDIVFPGYDHLSANGKLNAGAALAYRGSAAIKITSPHTDDGFHIGDTVAIRGFAVSTLFQKYSLSYGVGINPDDPGGSNFSDQSVWQPIVQSTNQIENGLLGKWNTTGLTQGYYTIRLAVTSSDLRSTEERMIVFLANRAPQFTVFSVDSTYVNEKRGLLVLASADVRTNCTVYFRADSTTNWSAKQDDRYVDQHSVVLQESDAPKGNPLEIKCVLKNLSGDSISASARATIANDGVSERGFSQKSYSLPPGYALDSVLETPAGEQVVMSVYPAGNDVGPLATFRFDPLRLRFIPTDSSSLIGTPCAIGNTRGDTKPELLFRSGDHTTLYTQNATHALLGDIRLQRGNFTASTLADINGDGHDVIFGVQHDTIARVEPSGVIDSVTLDSATALQWDGSVYRTIGTLPDTTALGPESAFKSYNPPNFAVADFFGDGKEEVVTIDEDADVLAYVHDTSVPAGFRPFFVDENNAFAQPAMVTTGDFDGDGRVDIAFVFHRTTLFGGAFNEFDPNYWTLKVFLNQGGGKFLLNTQDNFLPIRDPNAGIYSASLRAIPSVTGHGKRMLALSIFPNFYLLEYDSTAGKVKPVWHYPLTITNFGAIAHDFDHNGLTEFGFLAGDSIRFFESDSGYHSRTATPGGLTVIPRDSNRVDVEWGNVPGAAFYYLLRADSGAQIYNASWQVIGTSFTDSSVLNHRTYLYSVNAVDSSNQIPISANAFDALAYVHPTPRIDSVGSNGRVLMIHTSQPLDTKALSGGPVLVDDSIYASSVADASDSSLLVTLTESPSVNQTHQLRVTSWELRDRWNSPFDTSVRVEFSIPAPVEDLRFFIVSWSFLGSDRIHVFFNAVPGPDALDPSHYSITPYGTITKIERDPSDSLALYVDLNPATQIVPLGIAFVLCIVGIHNTSGLQLEATEGNCLGETLTAGDLSSIFVYPNPAKRSDGLLTFAGLTANAEISIYTQQMRFLRRFESTAKNGGVEWDMKDEAGNLLPTGIYIYHVIGKDDEGNSVTPHEGKFVIVTGP